MIKKETANMWEHTDGTIFYVCHNNIPQDPGKFFHVKQTAFCAIDNPMHKSTSSGFPGRSGVCLVLFHQNGT